MFTTNLMEFKTYQIELHKQAEHFRLVKSLERPDTLVSQLINIIGRTLVRSGQQLISRTQRAR
jgi:hypothetical protein